MTKTDGLDKNIGSEAWANKIRKHAKDLAHGIEKHYMDLAKTLYEVYSVPEGGDPKKQAIYKSWGFKSFAEYAEVELSMHRRKAEMLRAIWYRVAIELDGMPEELRERLIALGWTKVRELVRVLTLRNAAEWIEKAEDASQPELVEAIQKHVEAKKKKAAEKQKAMLDGLSEPASPEDFGTGEGGASALLEAKGNGGSSIEPSSLPSGPKATPDDDEELPVPPVEPLKLKQFGLYPDQAEVVESALERAQQLAESKKPSYLLTLICTDFLATNDFTTGDIQDRQTFIHKYEKMLGVKLIAVDEGQVIYGLDTLEHLAQQEE